MTQPISPLNRATLRALPKHIGRPSYDPAEIETGIVHFGPGAFHRAHQADYLNRILEHDPRWGIAAVSLRSPGTVEALRAQQGCYTLAVLDEPSEYRVLAAHNRFFGPGDGAAVRALLAEPQVRIVSSTVTEKGYCLAGDGTLDFGHPDIVHDLANPADPRSIIGWLALGLADRLRAGLPPFTPLICDNMASNGRKLGAAVLAFAERIDPQLARWIGGEVRFPNSMVDSITPATDEALRERVRAEIGLTDAIPVAREAYTAWIIEDVLPPGSPDLASAGAVMTPDVAAWEKAKLRILNGAHSTLAYTGLLMGHETVADAIADPLLGSFVERMVREEVIPTLPAAFDLQGYASETLQRFRNPVIRHKLSQIAWDGSQKLPYRLLDTIRDALDAGRSIDRLAVPIAAWLAFIQSRARARIDIVDPLGGQLSEIGKGPDADERLLKLRSVFPETLANDPRFRSPVLAAADALRAGRFGELLQR
jgi:fructuronate reductase